MHPTPQPETHRNASPLLAAPEFPAPHLLGFTVPQCIALAAGMGLWAMASVEGSGLPLSHHLVWLAALLVSSAAMVLTLCGKLPPALAWMLQAGILATASSALQWRDAHQVFKPVALSIAIVYIASKQTYTPTRGQYRTKGSQNLLIWALMACLIGDVCLMLPNLFLPGLVSFLIGHLFYIALFRRGLPWFAHRGGLVGWLLAGAVMYACVYAHQLPATLRIPVAAYVLVIVLMVAQAWGRWHVLRDRPALLVAWGATFFLLSDSLLAINRFVAPLPWSPLGVLGSYYAAQVLIVLGMVRGLRMR